MKKMPAVLVSALLLISGVAQAADLDSYDKIARETVRQAISGEVKDIDKAIADQLKMVDISVKEAKEYAGRSPKDAKLMNLLINNVDKMKTLSLKDIETQWHEGQEVKKAGITFDIDDHYSPAANHYDLIVHPMTSYLALREYKKTQNKEHLNQVKNELEEVLAHVSNLKKAKK